MLKLLIPAIYIFMGGIIIVFFLVMDSYFHINLLVPEEIEIIDPILTFPAIAFGFFFILAILYFIKVRISRIEYLIIYNDLKQSDLIDESSEGYDHIIEE